MLSHSIAAPRGWRLDRSAYLRRGWAEVLTLTVAAIVALFWFH
jgi:hypothetical protein